MPAPFSKITLSGTPEDIGYQHGKLLAENIHRNIAFYTPIFLKQLGTEAQILEKATAFKEIIQAYNPDYCAEIEHIASGADVANPLWIYALNARTELAVSLNTNECTVISFPQSNLLGQTWDWAEHLEENTFLMEIHLPSGCKILQLSEAGIIGKIGLNNHGLGVCLNILRMVGNVLHGIPIHIVLRGVLESNNIDAAIESVRRSGIGKASNIVIAQGNKAKGIEFAGSENYFHDIKDLSYVHTNHYIHNTKPVKIEESAYINSVTRYDTARERLDTLENLSIAGMRSILSDTSHTEHPILGKHKPHPHKVMGNCGTLATLIMDLDRKKMHLRTGNPASSDFSKGGFTHYQLE